ncbi:uncharacterized protein LOC118407660 [Branchiostoma floridae]|uniref:Uncharacterized protein LOC118407660 n=1 Tax=Branchiostoma floridae TaxID=7739 RepID=A0A9J7KHV5_BRAFL|nr:uncharacterized protein LOC118407660 [Branchiostoma floridae]
MRLSGGVLYLFLALTVVSAAPIHPVGRRSVLVGFKLVDAITWNPRAENNPDKLFALINGDLSGGTVLRPDVIVSGNDDTADVTSPGPGDADPGGASTNSATLS